MPAELPPNLGTLLALSNSLRPVARSLPLASLAALPKLTLLDLQYNAKLGGEATAATIREALPGGIEVRLTASRRQVTSGAAHGAPSRPPKASAALTSGGPTERPSVLPGSFHGAAARTPRLGARCSH